MLWLRRWLRPTPPPDLSQLLAHLQHLQRRQQETNSLLRELLVALTQRPAATPHTPAVPDPSPRPPAAATTDPSRSRPRTDQHVFYQTREMALEQQVERAVAEAKRASDGVRIVGPLSE